MEADNVNSISDTYESIGIAKVAEEVYYDLLSQADWPHTERAGKLEGLSNNEYPTHLRIPTDVRYIKALWYKGKALKYKEPEDFINYVNSRNLSVDSVVEVETIDGIPLKVVDNQEPTYFTIFSEEYVVTDSFNKEDGLTLLGDYAVFTGSFINRFESDDNFVPELPTNMFPTYLALVRRAAFMYFRREASPHDERAALAGMGRLFRDKYKLFGKENRVSYGRHK